MLLTHKEINSIVSGCLCLVFHCNTEEGLATYENTNDRRVPVEPVHCRGRPFQLELLLAGNDGMLSPSVFLSRLLF